MPSSRFPQRDLTHRTAGPAVNAPSDGLEGAYSATLHTAPSGGVCKVVIPALSLTDYRSAFCSQAFTGLQGDTVLVMFDENKEPWVISPSGVTPSGAAGGDLSGTYPNPTLNPASFARAAQKNLESSFLVISGAWRQVPIDTVTDDPFNCFSGPHYVCQQAGRYAVAGTVQYSLGGAISNWFIGSFVTKNDQLPGTGVTHDLQQSLTGATQFITSTAAPAGALILPVAGYLDCFVDDTIGLWTFASVTASLAPANWGNYLHVWRIA